MVLWVWKQSVSYYRNDPWKYSLESSLSHVNSNLPLTILCPVHVGLLFIYILSYFIWSTNERPVVAPLSGPLNQKMNIIMATRIKLAL